MVAFHSGNNNACDTRILPQTLSVWACSVKSDFCNPMDWGQPASSVHRISQTRILEWAAITFSRRIFLTQGVNLCLLHWQVDFLPLSHPDIFGKLFEFYMMYTLKVLVAQPCLTLCDPMDCSLPGSSVYGILQARILKWGAILFSMGSSRPRDRTRVSCIAGRFFTFWATRESKLEDCNVTEDCDVWCIRTDNNNGKCLGLFILENSFWQLTSFLWFPWLR